MATKKISELTELTSPAGTEELIINAGGTSKKITLANLPDNDTVYAHPNHSGDVTSTADGATVIGASKVITSMILDDNVTADKLANSINTDIAKGPAALPKAGGTMTGTIAGFTSTGIDDNATSNAITIDSSENVFMAANVYGDASSSGFLLKGGMASATNPTLCPNRADVNTGIGFNAADDLALIAGGVTGLRVDENASVVVLRAYGNMAMAAGKGIDFSADAGSTATGASSSSKVLDDYEEGAWTPVMIGGTQITSPSDCTYTKIGRVVTIHGYLSNSGVTDATAIKFSGLPFTVEGYGNSAAVNTNTNDLGRPVIVRGESGTTNIEVFYMDGTIQNSVAQTNLDGHFIFTLTYKTAT